MYFKVKARHLRHSLKRVEYAALLPSYKKLDIKRVLQNIIMRKILILILNLMARRCITTIKLRVIWFHAGIPSLTLCVILLKAYQGISLEGGDAELPWLHYNAERCNARGILLLNLNLIATPFINPLKC